MWNVVLTCASFAASVVMLLGVTAGWVENPAIQITGLPPYGGSGFMSGTVTGVGNGSAYSIAAYIQIEGLGWWTKPTFATPTVPVNSNCTFTVNVVTGGLDNYATIFCAALVAQGYTPPAASGSVRVPSNLVPRPSISKNAMEGQSRSRAERGPLKKLHYRQVRDRIASARRLPTSGWTAPGCT